MSDRCRQDDDTWLARRGEIISEFENCPTCDRATFGSGCAHCTDGTEAATIPTLADIVVPPPKPSAESLVDAAAYRSPQGHRNGLILGFSVYVLVAFYSMSASFRRMNLTQDFIDGTNPGLFEDLTAADDAVGLAAVLYLLIYLGVAIIFLAWFRRMYRNVPALGFPTLEYSPGWAVGAWFVPFLNLLRPKQIADDIWRGSDPERTPQLGQSWRTSEAPTLITWWWGVLIVGGIVSRFLFRADLETAEDFVAFDRLDVIATSIDLLAAPLAMAFVHLATKRQNERAERWLPKQEHVPDGFE